MRKTRSGRTADSGTPPADPPVTPGCAASASTSETDPAGRPVGADNVVAPSEAGGLAKAARWRCTVGWLLAPASISLVLLDGAAIGEAWVNEARPSTEAGPAPEAGPAATGIWVIDGTAGLAAVAAADADSVLYAGAAVGSAVE